MSTAFLAKWNEEAIDKNYEQWRRDPSSVTGDWALFFEGFELGFVRDQKRTQQKGSFSIPMEGDVRVENLVNAYRSLGHTMARLNPLNTSTPTQQQLEISEFGFSQEDLKTTVFSHSFRNGKKMSLENLILELRSIYCGTSTVEFMHIQDSVVRNWVRDLVEQENQENNSTPHYRILRTLHKAELFENFLHTTYVGS